MVLKHLRKEGENCQMLLALASFLSKEEYSGSHILQVRSKLNYCKLCPPSWQVAMVLPVNSGDFSENHSFVREDATQILSDFYSTVLKTDLRIFFLTARDVNVR